MFSPSGTPFVGLARSKEDHAEVVHAAHGRDHLGGGGSASHALPDGAGDGPPDLLDRLHSSGPSAITGWVRSIAPSSRRPATASCNSSYRARTWSTSAFLVSHPPSAPSKSGSAVGSKYRSPPIPTRSL